MTALQKRGDSQSFGVYNRLQGTLAKGSCLTLPRGNPGAEAGGRERAPEQNLELLLAVFRRQFVLGSMGCPQEGVPGESDLVTSA